MAQQQQQQQQQRQHLAQRGQAQVLELLRSAKQLLDSYAQLQPTAEAQQQLQALQQQHLQAAADVQATLTQCQALQTQEQAAAAQQDDAAAVAELQARIAQLQAQLASKNQAIKQVIDKLRGLIDASSMWESHKKHLTQHAVQYAAAGAGSLL